MLGFSCNNCYNLQPINFVCGVNAHNSRILKLHMVGVFGRGKRILFLDYLLKGLRGCSSNMCYDQILDQLA